MQETGLPRRFDPGSDLGRQPAPVPNPREIARAVGVGEIRPWYQPLVDLRTDEIVALEALARWDSPHRGMVYPEQFIATAEESELVVELDRAVARHAMTDLVAWSARHPEIRLNLNLSGRHLDREECPEVMVELADETGCRPDQVTLEFTEHRPPHDLETCQANIKRLREHGFQVWLDDFGSGWSGLHHLITFPVDGVKLDSAFVEVLDSRTGATVVGAVTGAAANLHMSVTVEGVQNREQVARALDLGADFGQGFLWSPALPVDRLLPEEDAPQ